MWVDDLRLEPGSGFTELSARVRTELAEPVPARVWFRVPDALAPREPDASPFVPALFQAATMRGERLVVEGPVSARLLEALPRAGEVMRSFWHPYVGRGSVEAEAAPLSRVDGATASFFTRGVDSWHSVLTGIAGAASAPDPPVTVLLYGASADWSSLPGGEMLPPGPHRGTAVELARRAAEEVGCELAVIDTNVREVRPLEAWGYTHGAVLASIALAAGRGVSHIRMASTIGYGDLRSNGSHPLLDPLWSTERTEIEHFGADVPRPEKTRVVAEHPAALRNLRVCAQPDPAMNCSRCKKCLRTMLALHLAGALDRAPTFRRPWWMRPWMMAGALRPASGLEHVNVIELIRECERTGAGGGGVLAALQAGLALNYGSRASRRALAAARALR